MFIIGVMKGLQLSHSNLFSHIFGPHPFDGLKLDLDYFIPSSDTTVSTKVTNDDCEITLDVPGHKSSDIEVTATDECLKVTSLHKTRKFVDRSWMLESYYDIKSIVASVADGVLTINISKKSPEQKKNVVTVKVT